MIAGAELVAEIGEKHDADGDADHAERKLKDAVGIVEPGHDAILEGGDDGRDHAGELADAAGDDAGRSQRDQPLHLGRETRALERHADAEPRRGEADHDDLQHAGDGDAPGEHHAGMASIDVAGGDQGEQHGDEHDVEQARREGGDGEAPERVQDAGIERDQRHADEIGQRDARQQHHERELLGVVR